MKKLTHFTLHLMLMLLILVGLLSGCASLSSKVTSESTTSVLPENTESADNNTKIAIVFATGGLGDKSYNDMVYDGAMRAEKELGVLIQYVEPNEIAEFEGHHREFAKSKNYDLIMGVGFDQTDAITKVAAEFPEQRFLWIDGTGGSDNIASVAFKDHEKAFLMGILVGMNTETNKVGFIGGMDIPLIEQYAAGYEAGLNYINPNIEMTKKFVGAWNDVNTAKELALSIYDAGADIIYSAAGGSSIGVHAAAKDADKLSASSTGNMIGLDPDHIIACSVRNLDEVVYQYITKVADGSFEPGTYLEGLAEGAVGIVNEGSNVNLVPSTLDVMQQAERDIISGKLAIPFDMAEYEDFKARLVSGEIERPVN